MPSGVRHVSFEASPPTSFWARARQSSSDFLGTSRSATGLRLLVPLWTPPVRLRLVSWPSGAGPRGRGSALGQEQRGPGRPPPVRRGGRGRRAASRASARRGGRGGPARSGGESVPVGG